jgi:hypothetical protein
LIISELNLQNVQEILAAGNYFQILAVVDACLNFLEGELDIENCIDLLIIAENFQNPTFRSKIIRFISGRIAEIFREHPDDFIRLQKHQLEELLVSNDLPVDCNEAEILKILLVWILKSHTQLVESEKILKLVNFKEISTVDVERILKTLHIKSDHVELCRLIWSFVVPHTSDQIKNEKKLLNSRGLELAIVKIGGFEIEGLTNDITYSFPSHINETQTSLKWNNLSVIPHVKQGSYGVSSLNNCIYVVGGSYELDMNFLDSHPFGFKYCPLSQIWTTIKPMNFERCRFSLNEVGGYLVAVGGLSFVGGHAEGQEGGSVASVEKYDASSDIWTILKPLPFGGLSQHSGCSYQNKLFISGGIDHFGSVLNSIYCFDLER